MSAASTPAKSGTLRCSALSRDAVVCLVDARVRVEPKVDHDPVDEVIDDDGDAVDAPEPVVQRLLSLSLHRARLAPG
jgi:hypothetical protein